MIKAHFYSVLTLLVAGGQSALPIDVQVATAKTNYYPGEQIEFLITVPTPGTLFFGSTRETLYTIDGVYTPSLYGWEILTQVTTPHTWSMSHDWSDYNIVPGLHTVVGIVVGYGTSPAASFSVVPLPAPTGNFVIDFDTIPGTTVPVANLLGYDACGVHFRTSLGAGCQLHGNVGARWVEGFDPYPAGFNVAADFAMPVFGASAKVAAGTNARITMTARNAQGQIIATAVSSPMAQPGQFSQTLMVKAAEPIASLEWWPSVSNSMVGVDDLFVITSPILDCALVGGKLCLTWGTVAGAHYQLWSSTDLRTWSTVGAVLTGGGGVLTSEISATGPKLFFRVSKSN